eukprot:TRINITY_DN5647_c0_g1_i4.p3 TRINITY_DN5647_c0_g1~~TRINITY_DN5647_c0_g1_i4.p3  ORF type:complete len:139 (+),score=5.63 TRINITY_DN5647_c0_g1_i4:119-535(+)
MKSIIFLVACCYAIYCPDKKEPDAEGRTCICAKGTYSANGRTACFYCDPGTYQPQAGQTNCHPCPEGTFASPEGQLSCAECPFGTYNTGTGNPSCSNCPAGTYSDGVVRNVCYSCPKGTYNPSAGKVGASSCLPCSPG